MLDEVLRHLEEETKQFQKLVRGLDNAGKSTLLTLLVRDEVVPHAPTHQPVTDVITIGAMKMRAVDMGGHEIARRMWEQYSQDADGIVYIVDAVDRERFQEAGLALHKLLATLAALGDGAARLASASPQVQVAKLRFTACRPKSACLSLQVHLPKLPSPKL